MKIKHYLMSLLPGGALAARRPYETHKSDSLERVLYLAEQGNAEAQYSLGNRHNNGWGVKKDKREAVRWYRKSAEQGLTTAQYDLGVMYEYGTGVEEDKREAARWYSKSAEQGLADAQHNLGVMYENGIGIKQDDGEAVRWYRKSAEQGFAESQNNLGAAYGNGEGVKQDYREAYIWFSIAKANGQETATESIRKTEWHLYLTEAEIKSAKQEAQRRLDEINNRAISLSDDALTENSCETHESDDLEGVRYLAEQGNMKAQYILGLMYNLGEGVKKDNKEAVRWYRKAAEQGHADAQYNLGAAYGNGEGVEQDYREAARWYRKSAEQGHADAQFNLGVAYNKGEGVKQDDRESARWWRKSAEQGFTKAQYNLCIMYSLGKGVIQDLREAYIWYSMGNISGNEDVTESLQKVSWHEYLTSSEIKSAKQEAKRRLAAIDNRAEQNNQPSASIGKVPAAKPPQNSNVAEKVFENAWRSIVVIKNDEGQGSGIIVRPNIVATNCHVIDGGNVIVYKHDNRQASTNTPFGATIRYRDDDYDFCLLDVPSLWGIPATMRKYNTLKIGENVYALGSPKGLDLSLSTGIISQLRRGETNRYIQTDAAISPGSSGGGLFDSEGNLIGILTKKLVDEEVEGIGFAIPADLALDLP